MAQSENLAVAQSKNQLATTLIAEARSLSSTVLTAEMRANINLAQTVLEEFDVFLSKIRKDL